MTALRHRVLAAGSVAGMALLAGHGAQPVAAASIDAAPQLDCTTTINTPATGNLTKTQRGGTIDNGDGSVTYTFAIHTTRPGSGTNTYTVIEDCAYVGGNPANIKYGTSQNNPFINASGNTTVTLTVDKNDTICDRVKLQGSDANGSFTDYSNLVGNCAPSTNVAEVPVTPLILGGGIAAILGAGVVARRRRHGRLVSI